MSWILYISVMLNDQSAVLYFVTSSCFVADIYNKIQGRCEVTAVRRNIKELHYGSQFMQSGSEPIPQTGRRAAKI